MISGEDHSTEKNSFKFSKVVCLFRDFLPGHGAGNFPGNEVVFNFLFPEKFFRNPEKFEEIIADF